MGRRKTKKIKPSKSNLALKNRRKLDREFHCHFCQHDRSVSVKIDLRSAVGFLSCRICGVTFSTRITSLDEPIDVYTVWMDKCRETDRALNNKEDDRNTKNREKPASDSASAKEVVDGVDKKPEARNRDDDILEADNAPVVREGTGEQEQQARSYQQELTDPYTDINYTDIMTTDLPHDFEEDQMHMNISRNTMTQRIIGADEPSGDFEQAENAGSRVHDLFQDDE